jgi:hypothetical protein
VGVNPSLTICALAERAIGLIPPKRDLKVEMPIREVPLRLWEYWIRCAVGWTIGIAGAALAIWFFLF